MKNETLDTANEIKSKLRMLKLSLGAFYWPQLDENGNETGKLNLSESRNPIISIEFDDLDEDLIRANIELPIVLNELFISQIEKHIKDEISKLELQFEKL